MSLNLEIKICHTYTRESFLFSISTVFIELYSYYVDTTKHELFEAFLFWTNKISFPTEARPGGRPTGPKRENKCL